MADINTYFLGEKNTIGFKENINSFCAKLQKNIINYYWYYIAIAKDELIRPNTVLACNSSKRPRTEIFF